ncbi:MAG: ATP-binding protein [Rubrobacteraceae bacterium]
MRSYRTLTPGGAGSWVIPLFALAMWALATLSFAAFSDGRASISTAVYGVSALFAFGSVLAATRVKYSRRGFWILLFCALTLRLVGDASWSVGQLLGVGAPPLWSVYAVYGTSYLLFFVAVLRLVFRATRGILSVVVLDAAVIMLSVGTLARYFVLDPAASGGASMAILSSLACEAGLLFLCLTVLSAERKPPFIRALAAAFLAFLAADGLYLAAHSAGPYEPGGWPEMFWALGLILFALCAMKPTTLENAAPSSEIRPWRVFSFWFGPLSPAMHCAFLLAWGAVNPPLPSYALVVGSAVAVYLAFRISLTAYITRKMRLEAQSFAVRDEQGRISEELHDTLKRSVHSVSLLLDEYEKARGKDDPKAGDLLSEALSASREANYQVGRPIEELRARWAGGDQDPSPLLGKLVEDFEKHFGIKPHEDLRADLSRLCPNELAAAYKIASEALRNAAKHSGAKNVWLESREVGPVTIVRIRDDGKGFSQEDTASGYGLASMRDRAERSGGKLDIISDHLRGTTVQVRFEKRGRL